MRSSNIVFTFLFIFLLSPQIYAQELSSCVLNADTVFETSTARIVDTHAVTLSKISLAKENELKRAFSLFSLKQSLAKMKDIREQYKNEERRETLLFKEAIEVLKIKHTEDLKWCDELSKDAFTEKE